MKFINFGKSYQRAKLVSYFTDVTSMLYHILVLFIFLSLKVYPMFFYNIASISIFAVILLFLPRIKRFEIVYFVALLEVIVHQILADYYLGTDLCFHYFILSTGLLPFFIFERNIKLSIPVAFFSMLIFIVLDNIDFLCKFEVSTTALIVLKNLNMFISVLLIVFMIMIYTIIVIKTEDDLELHNKTLEKEIKMASLIQQSFFKQDTSSFVNCKAGYYSNPMAGVSGDIYDFYSTNGNLEGIGIFDVSGHGISSGLVTMMVKNIITREFHNHKEMELWEILNRINDSVIDAKGDIENYLTGVLIRLVGTKLEISCAGHPMPIIYRESTGICEYLTQKKHSVGAIGISDLPVFYYSDYIDFNSGDELFLYSDGLTDVENSEGNPLGSDKLLEIVKKFKDESVDNQIESISKEIEIFRNGKTQNDDITFIILKK